MIDESLKLIGVMPVLVEPTLIVVLGGWIDAGAAAANAVSAINAESETTPFAEFDDDVYIDYRARRPTMELRDGLHTVLTWERIVLSAGSDQTGRDLIVLSGPEPDTAWHRFSRAVGDLLSTSASLKWLISAHTPLRCPTHDRRGSRSAALQRTYSHG